MKFLVVQVLAFLIHLQNAHVRSNAIKKTYCSPVTVNFCQDVRYNTSLHPTGVPGYRLQKIGRIVETGCSPHIAEFMCRLVAPECAPDGLDHPTRPCRPLCEKVKRDCEPVLQENGLNWPRKIQCQDLPEYNCKSVSTFFFFSFF